MNILLSEDWLSNVLQFVRDINCEAWLLRREQIGYVQVSRFNDSEISPR